MEMGDSFKENQDSIKDSMEILLDQNTKRLKIFAENAQDIIYRYRILPQKKFDYVSPASTIILGYTPEDHYKDPNLWSAILYEQDRLLFHTIQKQSPELLKGPLILRWKTKEGRVVWTEQRNNLIYDSKKNLIAVEGIIRDITIQKLAEQEIKNQAMQQAVILDLNRQALQGLNLSDLMDSCVVMISQAMEIEYTHIMEYFPEKNILSLKSYYGWTAGDEIIASDQSFHVSYALQSKTPIIVSDFSQENRLGILPSLMEFGILSGMSIAIPGIKQPLGVLSVNSSQKRNYNKNDIQFLQSIVNMLSIAIQRKETEIKLERMAKNLENALEENKSIQEQIIQKERLHALGQMASGIVHDLNNALAPIIGLTELLLKSSQNLEDVNKVAYYLEWIKTAAQDGVDIVKRLQNFYRARQAGELFTRVNINDLITQTINITQPKWKSIPESHNIKIEVKKDLHEIPEIYGNAVELREAFTNLLCNAVDALPEGGFVIFHTHADEQNIFIEVRDNGTGMSEEVRKKCLEPFYTTKGLKGTGLGLSMVYGSVQRHEGDITIISELGKGTAFLITLPKELKKTVIQKEEQNRKSFYLKK